MKKIIEGAALVLLLTGLFAAANYPSKTAAPATTTMTVSQLGPVPVCPPWKSGCTDPGYPYPQK